MLQKFTAIEMRQESADSICSHIEVHCWQFLSCRAYILYHESTLARAQSFQGGAGCMSEFVFATRVWKKFLNQTFEPKMWKKTKTVCFSQYDKNSLLQHKSL